MYAYIDGEFVEEKRASIPIRDRGFLFGDGIFTTVKIEGGEPLYLDDHLRKIDEQMEQFGILAEVKTATIFDFIRRNKLIEGRLKIIITGGEGRELALPKRGGRVVLLADPSIEMPKRLQLLPMQAPLFPGKLLSYMPRLVLKERAKPYDDCLLLDERGVILETAVGNVFWEVGEQLFTPDPERLPIYWGVSIENFCKKKLVQRVCTSLSDLPKEAQLFRINAVCAADPLPAEVVPAAQG